jgi:hypothetical protein
VAIIIYDVRHYLELPALPAGTNDPLNKGSADLVDNRTARLGRSDTENELCKDQIKLDLIAKTHKN